MVERIIFWYSKHESLQYHSWHSTSDSVEHEVQLQDINNMISLPGHQITWVSELDAKAWLTGCKANWTAVKYSWAGSSFKKWLRKPN